MRNYIDHYSEEKLGKIVFERNLFIREQKVIRLLKNFNLSFPVVLDIGCGTGFFLNQLREVLSFPEENLYGIDFSHACVHKAAMNSLNTAVCNIEDDLPFSDKQFDVIYAGEVIEHLYNPDFFLQECRRLLKNERSLLILSTPNMYSWYNRVLFLIGIQPVFYEVSTVSSIIGTSFLKHFKKDERPVGHLRLFGKRSIRDLLDYHSYKLVRLEGSVFEAFPKPIRIIDTFFNKIPEFSSIMIIIAKMKV